MGVKYSEVIERMRSAARLKNDSAVARTLGVTPQALSNYKKRGEMPSDLVLRFARKYSLSVDWLISGEGGVHRAAYKPHVEPAGLAAEEAAPYGQEAAGVKPSELASMAPDEIIYVGKLLKILRGPSSDNISAIKCSIDAFCKTAGLSVEPSKCDKDE